MAGDGEVAATGQTRAPFRGEVSQNRVDREWSVCVWVTRRGPRSHVVGPRGAHATAPLHSTRHTGPYSAQCGNMCRDTVLYGIAHKNISIDAE